MNVALSRAKRVLVMGTRPSGTSNSGSKKKSHDIINRKHVLHGASVAPVAAAVSVSATTVLGLGNGPSANESQAIVNLRSQKYWNRGSPGRYVSRLKYS
jgi:hypothetical protein